MGKFFKRLYFIILFWIELPIHISNISVALQQIYGEINRIRLIQGEDSKRGKYIEYFDTEKHKYYPFFDSKEKFDEFKAMKGEM